MIKTTLLILVLLLFMAMPVVAADEEYTLTLTAIADSMVDYKAPDANFPSDPNIGVHRVGPQVGQPCSSIKNLFARFQLPAGLTGQQMGNIVSANLQITQIADGVNAGLGFYAFGVKDGLDTASCNTYTWNNAPGYDPLSINASLSHVDYYDSTESYWLGNIDTYVDNATYEMYYITLDMSNWILSDTDGVLTYFITGYQPYEAFLKHFASIENPDQVSFPAPKLIFTYTLTPPACGDPGQIYSIADFNHDCYVDFLDFADFAGRWLDCTDRANPLCQ